MRVWKIFHTLIGAAIEAELRGRGGNPNLQSAIVENFPPLETPEGKTRDLVAKATDFGKHGAHGPNLDHPAPSGGSTDHP